MAWFGIEYRNLGTCLENKVHQKSNLSKYVNNKNQSSLFVFFNEKKIVKIRHRKWLWTWKLYYVWPSKLKRIKSLDFSYNDCSVKKDTKCSSNTLPCLVSFFVTQTLVQDSTAINLYWNNSVAYSLIISSLFQPSIG